MDGAQSYLGNADSLITIDIGAIAANWLYLDSLSPGTTETAAVVKADAYGLGAAMIAPPLAGVGCRSFFVMSLAEAVSLRTALRIAAFVMRGYSRSAVAITDRKAISRPTA